jgi:hypothetical protein
LRKAGLAIAQECDATVRSDGAVVGEHFVGLLVEQALPVELKTIKASDQAHRQPPVIHSTPSACIRVNLLKSA